MTLLDKLLDPIERRLARGFRRAELDKYNEKHILVRREIIAMVAMFFHMVTIIASVVAGLLIIERFFNDNNAIPLAGIIWSIIVAAMSNMVIPLIESRNKSIYNEAVRRYAKYK